MDTTLFPVTLSALVCLVLGCSPTRPISTGTVPAVAPDSLPLVVRNEIGDTTRWLVNHPQLGGVYPRNFVSIVFAEAASQALRQEAVDSIGGTVVGGARIGSDGIYIVRLVDDGTAAPLLKALAVLGRLRHVEAASGVGLGTGPR